MKKTMNRLFLIFTLLLVIPVYAQVDIEKTGQAGMPFLSIPTGARASAMGNAFVAVAENSEAMFWNPAGIAAVSKMDFSSGYTRWIADITHYHAGLVYNAGNIGVFGINLLWVDYGDLQGARRSEAETGYVLTGTFNPIALVGGLAYGRQLTDRISFGANLKLAYQDLGGAYIGDFGDFEVVENTLAIPALDIGVIYFTGFKDLKVGMKVENVSYEKKYVEEDLSLPFNIRMGVAMDILTILAPEGSSSLILSIDATHPRDYKERLHIGMEYSFRDILFLRGGYKLNYDEDQLSCGIGISPTIPGPGNILRFDYAFNPFGNLGSPVHRISIGTSF